MSYEVKREEARAWAQLVKHGARGAKQRDHDRQLVRVDTLLTPEAEAALSAIVYELQKVCAKRLTRAEVARHLLTRSIWQCQHHTERLRKAGRVAARREAAADAIRASRRA